MVNARPWSKINLAATGTAAALEHKILAAGVGIPPPIFLHQDQSMRNQLKPRAG